jgi:hypothetical protein
MYVFVQCLATTVQTVFNVGWVAIDIMILPERRFPRNIQFLYG